MGTRNTGRTNAPVGVCEKIERNHRGEDGLGGEVGEEWPPRCGETVGIDNLPMGCGGDKSKESDLKAHINTLKFQFQLNWGTRTVELFHPCARD